MLYVWIDVEDQAYFEVSGATKGMLLLKLGAINRADAPVTFKVTLWDIEADDSYMRVNDSHDPIEVVLSAAIEPEFTIMVRVGVFGQARRIRLKWTETSSCDFREKELVIDL